MQVPVLDASQSDAALAPLLRAACERVGFFLLVNHGLVGAQRDALAASARLFELPNDVKETLRATPATNNRGWTRLGEETLDPSRQSRGDTKEGYYIGREVPSDSAEAALPLHGALHASRTLLVRKPVTDAARAQGRTCGPPRRCCQAGARP